MVVNRSGRPVVGQNGRFFVFPGIWSPKKQKASHLNRIDQVFLTTRFKQNLSKKKEAHKGAKI